MQGQREKEKMITKEAIVPKKGGFANLNDASNENAVKTTESSLGQCFNAMPEISITKEHGNRKFDADKVARIKAQIASGEYEINPSRIVSKIVENRT